MIFRLGLRRISFLAFLFACTSYSNSQDTKSIEADLRQNYEQKILSLRKPYFGKALRFDSTGNLTNQAMPGPWSTCGLLQVEKIKVNREGVEVDGKRVILALRSNETEHAAATKKVQVVPALTNDDIRIHMQVSPSDTKQVNKALAQIFQSGELLDRVSAYWKPMTNDVKAFRASTPDGVFGELDGNRPVYLVNPGVTAPPKALYTPEPEYTDAARRSRTEGTAQLSVIINEAGFPEVLEIVEGLGEGLDINALSTVAKWRFHPALRAGKPVAAMIYVEVTFHLR